MTLHCVEYTELASFFRLLKFLQHLHEERTGRDYYHHFINKELESKLGGLTRGLWMAKTGIAWYFPNSQTQGSFLSV